MINKIVLYIIVLLLVSITCVYAEPRRSISVYANGEHVLVPNVGECDSGGCVITEHYTEQWNGARWIHQTIDVNEDGVCDVIRVWKPLEDPEYGIFYTIYTSKPCSSVI